MTAAATETSSASPTGKAAIPLGVKLAYTGFLLVLVPFYWRTYGPTNFLYFCDVALFMALGAVWLERALWASLPAVGILVPQTIWIVDFLAGLAGWNLTGMTQYMFDPQIHSSRAVCRSSTSGCRCFCSGCFGGWVTIAAPVGGGQSSRGG
jgi:hypothetical protein